MKKSIVITLVIISIFAVSCAPQVTVISEVTVTSLPPTETPIPTPTLHPQFSALQNLVANEESGRFTLTSVEDGLLFDGKPTGIDVDNNGVMTIDVNGEEVVVDPSTVHFGHDGLSIDGYEDVNNDGVWELSVPLALSTEVGMVTQAILDSIGVPAGVVELRMKGDSVVCIDSDGKEICRDGEFDWLSIKDIINQYGKAMSVPEGPDTGNVPSGTATDSVKENVTRPIVKRVATQLAENNNGDAVLVQGHVAISHVFLSENDDGFSWGVRIVVERDDPNSPIYFAYENEQDELIIVPLK